MQTRYFSGFEKAKIYYSNFFVIFGTIWMLFVIVLVIVVSSQIVNQIALNKSNNYTEGNIINTEKRLRKGKTHYYYTISYKVNGNDYEIVSRAYDSIIEDKIKIKYVPDKPEIASFEAIERDSELGVILGTLFLSIFLVVGFFLLRYGVKKSRQNINVLENGEVAFGKFLRSEATNTTINNKRVMKLYFSFTDKYGKEQETCAETHQTVSLQDEALEILVYMPDNTEKSVFLDMLPSFVRKRLEPEFVKLRNKSNF